MNRLYVMLLIGLFAGLLSPVLSLSAENSTKPQVEQQNLDEMITHFRSKEKRIEITLFRPMAFTAQLVSLPEKKKTDYLQGLLHDFVSTNPPSVTHGMRVRSEQGKEYQLYVADELVPTMQDQLKQGDQLQLQAYHAYNSPNGPALLVYQFERLVKPGVVDQLKAWWADK